MPLALLTLITGLAISAVAIYYSVIGLAAIFSAAVIPIIVMGSILEVSKLVTAWWLKANWYRAPFLLKSYMLVAVMVLMLITSMGIFGFLSKAHTDQAITSGDVQGKIALYDEKINIERENIANARSLIKQMDDAVTGIQANGTDREIKLRDGRTYTRSAAELALSTRRSQAKDRAALTKQIEEAQDRIVKLQEAAAPIRSEVRKVEAEVGPIKYIAKLIYGDNPDTNLLEKAVTWVIITIVFVFDPLAVLLLLASQMSFQWARQQKEERKDELVQEETPPEGTGEETPAPLEPANEETMGRDEREVEDIASEANRKLAEIEPEFVEPEIPQEYVMTEEEEKELEKNALAEWNKMIEEAEKAVDEEDDREELENASPREKAAMQQWKRSNLGSSLKIQRHMFNKGKITKLPWDDYLKAHADDEENLAAVEAAKWAQEQIEKSDEITYIEKEGNEQIKKVGYKQNEEQSDSTIWQRVKDIKK